MSIQFSLLLFSLSLPLPLAAGLPSPDLYVVQILVCIKPSVYCLYLPILFSFFIKASLCCMMYICIRYSMFAVCVFVSLSLSLLFYAFLFHLAFSRMVPPCKPGPAQGLFLLKGTFSCYCGIQALGCCLCDAKRGYSINWKLRWIALCLSNCRHLWRFTFYVSQASPVQFSFIYNFDKLVIYNKITVGVEYSGKSGVGIKKAKKDSPSKCEAIPLFMTCHIFLRRIK